MRIISVLFLSTIMIFTTSCSGSEKGSPALTTRKSITSTTSTTKNTGTPRTDIKATQIEFENKMADLTEQTFSGYIDKSKARAYGICAGKISYSKISDESIELLMKYQISDAGDEINDIVSDGDSTIMSKAGDDCEDLLQAD